MKRTILYTLWGCLYILCVGLGFVNHAQGVGRVLLILTGVIFYVPGVLLLRDGIRSGHRKTLLRIRWISAASLSLTVVLLILNFLSVRWSASAGRLLYELLVLVSAPMMCCQYWVLSLFLWACMLMASFKKLAK